MSLGCGYPVLLMRLHKSSLIFLGLSAHEEQHCISLVARVHQPVSARGPPGRQPEAVSPRVCDVVVDSSRVWTAAWCRASTVHACARLSLK
eukprot:6990377-Prymnesium_polylepis.1